MRQAEETESHEVFWPYSIKSLAINPVKHSVVIISQSLQESDSDENLEKTLVFELSLKLMASKKTEATEVNE